MIQMFVVTMAARLPGLLLNGIGMVIALFRWKRHPPVSLLAFSGFGISALGSIVNAGLITWISTRASGMEQRAYAFYASSGLYIFMSAIATILLICAVFGWRSSTAQPTEDHFTPR